MSVYFVAQKAQGWDDNNDRGERWERRSRTLESTKLVQPVVHVLSATQFLKHWEEIEQLAIFHVIEPRQHRNLQGA